ncbi:MAG TPA: hypothetical protein PKE20_14285, partial [Promineifilum sp.]|nr:hypothetical protein [Promineifilum sp.]
LSLTREQRRGPERRPDAGEIIVCPECETSLEVIRSSPIRFGWPDDEADRGGGSGAVNLDEFFRNLEREDRDRYDDEEEDEQY